MKSLVALVVAFTIGAPIIAAETYTLVFDRTVKPGERFTFEAKTALDEANNFTVNGAPTRNEKKSATCKISGELEIVAVHANGQAREVNIKVAQAEATENGKPIELFRAGDKIHLTRGEKREIAEVQGQPASPFQAKLLNAFSFIHSGSSITDDQIFGAGHAVKAGDEWPVHSDVAATDPQLKDIGEFKADDIKGTVRCLGAASQGDIPCVKTRAEMKMSTSQGSFPGMPPQIKVRSLVAAMTGETDLPVDPAHARPWDTMDMTLSVEAGGKIERDGASQTIEIHIDHHQTKEMRLTPVK